MPDSLKSPPESGETEILGSAPSVGPAGPDATRGAEPSVGGPTELVGVQRGPNGHGSARPSVAVVLAAGRSERLQTVTGGGSKALIRLGGLAIVQRTVLTLLSYGLNRVVVVTGYHAGPVGTVIDRIAPGRVRAIYAGGWEAGNGATLAAAEPAVAGEPSFVLMTADHLFGEGAFRELLRAPPPACLIEPIPDADTWAEGTRVLLRESHQVLAFGKELAEPGVDCGVFLLTPEVFECQREAAAEGDYTLAGALTRLAQRRPVRAIPLPDGCWWRDVDTPKDLSIARARLRRSLAKPEDGPISRFLNRAVSTRVSMAMAPLRPNPDLVSLLVMLVGLLSAGLLGFGMGVVGGLLAQAVSILDGVDGELARLQVRARPLGALLDGVLDRVVDAALLAGLGVWALRSSASPGLVLALTVAATAGAMLSMATKDRIRALGLPGAPERHIAFLLGGRDGRLLLVAVFAVFGLPVAALAAVAVPSWLSLTVRVIAVQRNGRTGTPRAGESKSRAGQSHPA
jgi:1L-myo-inositol 1-phosphate cytidylyltransferase / CDP-L-myo-inositol myo-inositolphosphotransferase